MMTYRLVMLIPVNWVFVVACVLLRAFEGIASAMFITATFSVLPRLYSKSVGTITVKITRDVAQL